MKSLLVYGALLLTLICLVTPTCVKGPGQIDPPDSFSVIELDTADLRTMVLEADTNAMVEFTSPTCRYCIRSAEIVDTLNQEYGDVMIVATINVDSFPEVADSNHFDFVDIPTFIWFRSGQEYTRRSFHQIHGGWKEYDSLAAITEEMLSLTSPAPAPPKKERLEP